MGVSAGHDHIVDLAIQGLPDADHFRLEDSDQVQGDQRYRDLSAADHHGPGPEVVMDPGGRPPHVVAGEPDLLAVADGWRDRDLPRAGEEGALPCEVQVEPVFGMGEGNVSLEPEKGPKEYQEYCSREQGDRPDAALFPVLLAFAAQVADSSRAM